MPKRPPKLWWNRCIRSVKKNKNVDNPSSICGNTWYHKLTQKQKNIITKESELKSRKGK